jgi:hypothetical protein
LRHTCARVFADDGCSFESNALAALRTRAVGVSGATGALLDRTLTDKRELLSKRSLESCPDNLSV